MRPKLTILFGMALCAGLALSAEPKEKEKEKLKPDLNKSTHESQAQEKSTAWILAIDLLRQEPRPGEVINGGISASFVDVFELKDEDKVRVNQLMQEYEEALLKKAAAWDGELRAMRAECENKLLQNVPEGRRAQTQKVLDFSHAQWAEAHGRVLKLDAEYSRRIKAQKEALATTGNDDVKNSRNAMLSWLREEHQKWDQRDEATLKAIREMLTPEEAARLEQFDRKRPPAAPPAPANSIPEK